MPKTQCNDVVTVSLPLPKLPQRWAQSIKTENGEPTAHRDLFSLIQILSVDVYLLARGAWQRVLGHQEAGFPN